MTIEIIEPQLVPRCPDCFVGIGERHKVGCDVEGCPYCGGQMLFCCCGGLTGKDEFPFDDRIPWQGLLPGERECWEFGWYAKRNPVGSGWIACDPDEYGSIPDLNRLRVDATWSRRHKRWVKRK